MIFVLLCGSYYHTSISMPSQPHRYIDIYVHIYICTCIYVYVYMWHRCHISSRPLVHCVRMPTSVRCVPDNYRLMKRWRWRWKTFMKNIQQWKTWKRRYSCCWTWWHLQWRGWLNLLTFTKPLAFTEKLLKIRNWKHNSQTVQEEQICWYCVC